MDFNRLETFINDKLYYQGAEYIQRDIQLNTPLHYLVKGHDQEVDTILTNTFENVRHFYLPLAEQMINCLLFLIMQRKTHLSVFYKSMISDIKSGKKVHLN